MSLQFLNLDDLLERKRDLDKAMKESVDQTLELLQKLKSETSDFDAFKKSELLLAFRNAENHPNEEVRALAKNVLESWKTNFKNSKKQKSAVTITAQSISVKTSPLPLTSKRANSRNLFFQKLQKNAGPEFSEEFLRDLVNRIEDCVNEMEHQEKKYKSRCLTLLNNLETVKETSEALLNGSLTPEEFGQKDSNDLQSEAWKQQQEEWKQKALLKNQIPNKSNAHTTDYKCPKCGQQDSFYYEKQTRSADEPMTVFLTCNGCQHKWRG